VETVIYPSLVVVVAEPVPLGKQASLQLAVKGVTV
jgi:hypothetical protein